MDFSSFLFVDNTNIRLPELQHEVGVVVRNVILGPINPHPFALPSHPTPCLFEFGNESYPFQGGGWGVFHQNLQISEHFRWIDILSTLSNKKSKTFCSCQRLLYKGCPSPHSSSSVVFSLCVLKFVFVFYSKGSFFAQIWISWIYALQGVVTLTRVLVQDMSVCLCIRFVFYDYDLK